MSRFLASWVTRISLLWIAFLVFAALFPGVLQNHNPRIRHDDPETFQPAWLLEPGSTIGDVIPGNPDKFFLLGTDGNAGDIWSRIIEGARPALIGVLVAVSIAAVVGLAVGLFSGYVGGIIDRAIQWVVESIFAIPTLMLALAVVSIREPTLVNAMIAVGIVSSTRIARLARAAVISEKEELYVDGARLAGIPRSGILFRHIAPNIMPVVLVQLSLLAAATVIIAAALSFIGVTGSYGEPDWGADLVQSQQWLRSSSWDVGLFTIPGWLALPPGLMIVFSALAFNYLGDGIRDAMAAGFGQVSGLERVKLEGRKVGPAPVVAPGTLTIRDLQVRFAGRRGEATILDEVTLELAPGETLGLVGESGSGKSMTALSLLGMTPEPGRVTNGEVWYDGAELINMAEADLARVRGARIAIIFQEPIAALNPTKRVGDQIAEPIVLHKGVSRRLARTRAVELLDRVGVPDPAIRARQYPHEFSGGMAQRAVIARALAADPQVLICDEPTTALDVTIQGQVLDLLNDLQAETGMSMLFITHDLGVVAEMCDRIAVMYAGQIVETGTAEQIFYSPKHPYTSALLQTSPESHGGEGSLFVIPGRVPPPVAWPSGCRFHPRCEFATDVCSTAEVAQFTDLGDGRTTRCGRITEIGAQLLTGSDS